MAIEIIQLLDEIGNLKHTLGMMKKDTQPSFNILNPDLWGYALKDKPFVWDGIPLFKADASPMSERDAADLFEAIFAFLERDGKIVPLEKKQHGIRTVLGRMRTSNAREAILEQQRSWARRIDYQDQSQEHYRQARALFECGDDFYDELSKSRMLGLLNLKQSGAKYVRAVCRMPCRRQCVFPDRITIDEALRNPIIPKHDALDTWYFDYDDPEEAIASGEIIGFCHGEWEEANSLLDAAMAKMRGKEELWGKAVAQAKGVKRLDDTTPGYRERINELFQQLYKKSAVNDDGKWAENWFQNNPKHT